MQAKQKVQDFGVPPGDYVSFEHTYSVSKTLPPAILHFNLSICLYILFTYLSRPCCVMFLTTMLEVCP